MIHFKRLNLANFNEIQAEFLLSVDYVGRAIENEFTSLKSFSFGIIQF